MKKVLAFILTAVLMLSLSVSAIALGQDVEVDVGDEIFTPGNINGDDDIDVKDVVVLAKVAAGWENVSCIVGALDPNGDKNVNLNDVVHLARYIAGWEDIELSNDKFEYSK